MSAILSLILNNGIVQALIAGVAALLAFWGWGAAKKREGRQEGRAEAAEDTIERVKDGQRQVDRNRGADLDERLRRNDEEWRK